MMMTFSHKNWLIGLGVMLAWPNLAQAQEEAEPAEAID